MSTANGAAAPAINRLNLEPGQILFCQGSACEGLYILQQGVLEVLVCDALQEGMPAEQVVEASHRVVCIDRPGPIGDTGFLFNEPHAVTVCALSPAAVSRLEVNPAAADAVFEKSPRIALEMGRMLFYRYHQTVYRLEGADELLHKLQQLYDNGSLLLSFALNELRRLNGEQGKAADLAGNPHLTRALYLWAKLKEASGSPTLDAKVAWLKQDLSPHFGEQYGLLRRRAEGFMSKELVAVLETLLNTCADRFAGIIVEAPDTMLHLCRFLGSLLPQLNSLSADGRRALEQVTANLAAGDNSLLGEVMDAVREARGNPRAGDLTAFLGELYCALWEEVEALQDKYVELCGGPPRNLLDGRAFYAELEQLAEVEEAERPKEETTGVTYDWTDFAGRLAGMAGWDDAGTQGLRALIKRFRELPNPQDIVDEAKKVRVELGKTHWRLYNDVYLKVREQKPLAADAKFYLRYGMLDGMLLPPEQANVLAAAGDDPKLPGWPIYYADEWLRRIWRGKETTSLTEVGQTFDEVMADQQGAKKKGQAQQNIEESLVSFEIAQLLTPGARMTSRSLAMGFPLLCDLFLGGELKAQLLTRQRVMAAVQRIRELDYSLFYREVRVVHQGAVHFVQKEVLPSIILLPCAGDRALCWQEMEGTNKQKPGRILLPLVLREDLDKVLLEVLGKYRWELNRTCAGYNWANPAEGGLTGNYFDYACFFHKNPELSTEAKDDIRQYFKRYTSTADRFTRDYMLWMLYEKDGVLKLNKATRKIFFKYVPFPKAVRETLNRFPAFQDLVRIDGNLRTKRLIELANRAKKFEKTQGKIPEFMQSELQFHSR